MQPEEDTLDVARHKIRIVGRAISYRAARHQTCRFIKRMAPSIDDEYESEMRSLYLRTGGQGRKPRTGSEPVVQAASLYFCEHHGTKTLAEHKALLTSGQPVCFPIPYHSDGGKWHGLARKPVSTSPATVEGPPPTPKGKKVTAPVRMVRGLSIEEMMKVKECAVCGNPEGFLCGHKATEFHKQKGGLKKSNVLKMRKAK